MPQASRDIVNKRPQQAMEQPIGRTSRKASPGLSPTAAVMIHNAQPGRLSMARCPPLFALAGARCA
jgi:hypothetical protein